MRCRRPIPVHLAPLRHSSRQGFTARLRTNVCYPVESTGFCKRLYILGAMSEDEKRAVRAEVLVRIEELSSEAAHASCKLAAMADKLTEAGQVATSYAGQDERGVHSYESPRLAELPTTASVQRAIDDLHEIRRKRNEHEERKRRLFP